MFDDVDKDFIRLVLRQQAIHIITPSRGNFVNN